MWNIEFSFYRIPYRSYKNNKIEKYVFIEKFPYRRRSISWKTLSTMPRKMTISSMFYMIFMAEH